MLACEEVPNLLEEAVRCVADTLGVEFVVIWELLPEGDNLLLRAGLGWHKDAVGQQIWQASLQPCVDGSPFPCRAFAEGKMRGHCGRCSPLPREHGVQSGICVVIQGKPALRDDRAYTPRLRTFTRDEIHFLQDIAIEITLAIEGSKAEQRRRERETLRAEQMALIANSPPASPTRFATPLPRSKCSSRPTRKSVATGQ